MKSKVLFFDARFIRVRQHDGISRFSVGLFEALAKKIDVIAIICDLRQLEKLPVHSRYLLVNEPTSIKELFLAKKLNAAGAEIVFSTMQTMGSFGKKYKLVLTLHDLIYYRHPAPPPYFNALIRFIWRLYHKTYWPQRFLLNRADAVAAVSATTKRLIIENRLTKKPVTVVYNAANSLANEVMVAPKMRPESARLVYMGSFMEYKNVETLIAGMSHLEGYELHLLSGISEARRAQLQSQIPKGAKVIFHNGVSDAEYRNLVSGSVALVSASLDEGFGIPLIEAMSMGTPVVISDLEIFREVAGDAGLYFNPANPKSFAESVEKLRSNADWMKYSALSLQNASRFNWNESANALLRAIDELGA